MENLNNITEREIKVSGMLNATVEEVWEAWSNPKKIKVWWGPTGFTNTITKMDLQPEGEWLLVMHGPDGKNYNNRSIFKEIEKFKKIKFEHFNPHFMATIHFEAQGAKTYLEWQMLFDTKEQLQQVVSTFKADEGLKQNLVKLNAYLNPKSTNI